MNDTSVDNSSDEEIVLDTTGFYDEEVLDKQSLAGCYHSGSHLNEEGNEVFTLNGRIGGKFVSKNVVTLSKRKLAKAEISLLSKGLKFVPTSNHITKARLKMELEAYSRMLRLKWHFRNDEKEFDRKRFKPKSTFNPRNKDVAIEIYLSSLEEKLMNIEIPQNKYNNLTREERTALYDLKNDKNIIIKSADKGSAVVVWDSEDYIKEAEKQLGDKDVYEEVCNDAEPLINTIHKAIEKIRKRGDLDVDTIKYFMVKDPKFVRLYLLPKIHKRLHDVPGRPVISNCNYHTENISSFLDFHLQPLARGVKSYIKDTNHFLKKLRSLPNLPDDIILCTVDVVGLYPNIPHEDGLYALRKRLDLRQEKDVTTSTLVELAEVVLKSNIFTFKEKTLKQKRGTAIGTKFAPPYSILFMAELEEEILSEIELKPYLWWRYIDDIFFLWEHGEEKLKEFIEHLNEKHPTIKFTAEWSQTSINFLDVTVSLIGGKINTDLYVKPTDSHQYIHSSSCHSYHCKKGIPYSQALRLNRICSDPSSFDKRCNDLEKWLIERGYSEREVRKQVLRARSFSRDSLLDKASTRDEQNKITFNLTYYPAFQNVKKILAELHLLLTPDVAHKTVFTNVPTIGFKNDRSLKDHLVRAVLPNIDAEGRSKPCGGKKRSCEVCKSVNDTSYFKRRDTGETFDILKGPLDCNSNHVIYLFECKKCQYRFPYVGSTKTKFRYRINNYKSTHRKFRKKYVEKDLAIVIKKSKLKQKLFHEHYCSDGHQGIENWSVTLIDRVEDLDSLRKKELYWINRLNTWAPFGLNVREVYEAYN